MAPMYPPEGTRLPNVTPLEPVGPIGKLFDDLLKGVKTKMSEIKFVTPFGSVNLTPDVKGITLEEVTKTVERAHDQTPGEEPSEEVKETPKAA